MQISEKEYAKLPAHLRALFVKLPNPGAEEVLGAFEKFGESKSRQSDYNWQPSGNDNPANVVNNIRSGVHFDDAGSPARFFYNAKAGAADRSGSEHPTVKPIDLMRYLVRLVTPPGGTVLDPFAGTGSTGLAAQQLGFNAVLIEQDETYCADARRKLRNDPYSASELIINNVPEPPRRKGLVF